MGVSPFIYGPVTVLGVLALLSVAGLGATGGEFGNITFTDVDPNNSYYFDQSGSAVCYRNLTAVAGQQQGTLVSFRYGGALDQALWRNSTGEFLLFNDAGATQPTDFQTTWKVTETQFTDRSFEAEIGTTLGLIAVIAGIVAIGVIASVKIFGFGLSDTGINTLMKGGAYIMIWAIFSGLAMNLIVLAADFYTPIIYLALTGAYTFGCLGDIGSPSSG